jgi:hypothetical protein
MDEEYRGQSIVTGEEKYWAYRQFRVETAEAVKD